MSGRREFDVVLLGATGFTGRLTAEQLAHDLAGTPTRWAVAGRDLAKLGALADQLPTRPAVEVVDTHDLVGLLDLAERTRVLATAVGPYLRHGELVAQACVRSGTHYADVTGEARFVELIRSRYHLDAQRRGVKLISCCGFDSVPHDLGTRATVAHLPDDAALTVRAYVRTNGQVSGGTAITALETIAGGGARPPRTPMDDADGRPVSLVPSRIHRVAELDGWGVPLPTVDPAIVLRSAQALDGYGTRFRYGHNAFVGQLPVALGGVVGVGIGAGLARFGPTRSVLSKLLPAPGDGPDAQRRARHAFDVTFIGTGGGSRVVTRVSGGDMYAETARMFAAAARTLLDDTAPDVAGALTPAVGLGTSYHERLVASGLRFEVLDRS